MFDPKKIVADLSVTHSNVGYISKKIHNTIPLYIGKNSNNEYALILLSKRIPSMVAYKTNLLSLRTVKKCTLNIDKIALEYTNCYILHCHSTDSLMYQKFITLSLVAAKQFNSITDNAKQLLNFFTDLAELFKISSLKYPVLERQGFWGELFMMFETGNFIKFFEAWHQDPKSKFDFAKMSKRIEVKTTLKDERIHTFSHRQLYLDNRIEGTVLSIKLYAVPNGLSLRNLINYARQEVKTDIKLLLKLEKEVARTKMVDPNETGPIFDEVYARENMKWCWIEDVPKFYCIYPKGVSNCYYDSDLSYANDINDKELNKWLDTW